MCTTSYDQYLEVGDPVRTAAGIYRVCVTYDPDGFNPRDDEGNAAKIVCPTHRDFNLPCEPDSADRDLMWQILSALERRNGARVALRYLSVVHDAVALPIYGYQWYWTGELGDYIDDHACIGVIYVKRADVAREWRDNISDADIAAELAAQVQRYSAWANGDTTGYVIQRATCAEPDHTDCGAECWEEFDSCGTYYSESEAMAAGREAVPTSLTVKDLAALAALDEATKACNAADTQSLASQLNGAYGLVSRAFVSAAVDLLGRRMAHQVFSLLVTTGEDVEWCINYAATQDPDPEYTPEWW